jgi:hypothetical protein
MSASRVFGPRPSPAYLRELGLAVPDDAFRCGTALLEQAEQCRGAWYAWKNAAMERVLALDQDPAAPKGWLDRATVLVGDIHRAGLRVWLSQVLGVRVPIQTTADLRCWCALQLRSLEISLEAYPVALWSRKLGGPYFPDNYLLEWGGSWWGRSKGAEALPGPELYSRLGKLYRIGPEDDEYDQITSALEEYEGLSIPRFPSRKECFPLLHTAWEDMRRLSQTLGRPCLPDPEEPADFDDWRLAFGQIVNWCFEQENTPPASPAPAQAEQDSTGGRGHHKQTGREQQGRSWTQSDLDQAIWQYKAQRADSYKTLVEGVKEGRPGARKDAQKTYGRNAIARALGVKAQAMVSKSPAWQEIAAELQLSRKGPRQRRLDPGKRIGGEIAEEQEAENRGDATFDAVTRNETLRLIKKHMPPDIAEATLHKLEIGEMTDEQAQELVNYYSEQRKDDTRRVRRSP